MTTYLKSLIDKPVCVITCDGKTLVVNNLVLEDSHERIYSETEGVDKLELGLYIVRGPNVSVVGELDKEADDKLNLDDVHGRPLGHSRH